jgi:hypothetical protein
MTRTTPTRTQLPLRDRLMLEASRLTDQANKLPPGPLRDAMIRKARESEIALHMDQWLSSPGLQAPC